MLLHTVAFKLHIAMTTIYITGHTQQEFTLNIYEIRCSHEAVKNIFSTDSEMHHTNNQVFQLSEAFTQYTNHQTDT